MRCKKHPTDVSCTIGVCASCLRQRLIAIIAAQEQLDFAKSDAQQQQPPPLSFPRSVSPYISRRKSDTGAGAGAVGSTWQRFHTTPLVLPTGSVAGEAKKKSSGGGRFASLFRGLFRSKSDKSNLDSDPSSRPGVSADSHKGSPSWLSTIVPGRRKKQIRTFSLDEGIANNRRSWRNRDRGMSPARYSDEEEYEHYAGSEKQTPWRTPAAMRRGGTVGHNMNMANLAFCLSPLVRPSPNRHWNMPPDTVVAGESRVPTKPRLSTATSFCKNRSRKLADIGRYNYNPNY